jgi:tetratricopeptide (TPR) repeat protein
VRPDFAEAYHLLGLAYGRTKKYEEALAAFEQATRINPQDGEARRAREALVAELDRLSELVTRGVEGLPYLTIGEAYMHLGWSEKALTAFRQATRFRPGDASAYYHLGLAFYGQGRYTDAIEAYRKAISLRRDLVEAQYNLGWTYHILGEKKALLKQYQTLRSLDAALGEKLLKLTSRGDIKQEAKESPTTASSGGAKALPSPQ